MKAFQITALGLVLLLSGCGDDSEPEATGEISPREAARGNPLLAGVDADTAYVYANIQRLPDAVVDKVWALQEASGLSNRVILDALADDDELPPAARALVGEVASLMTREGWEAAGLPDNPYYVMHGAELMPMFEMELADPAAFRALIDRVEADLETPLERRDIDGVEVIWIESGPDTGLAIAVRDTAVTVGVIPDQAPLLARVAGHYTPPETYSAEALAEFSRDVGLSGYGSGFFDWQRVVAEFLDGDSLVAQLGDDDELRALREDPACIAEFQALTDRMPRAVFGYTRLNTENADFLMRQELSPELAAEIAPIARAPVSLERDLDGLASVGLALDLVAAREFARTRVEGLLAEPPECAAFAELVGRLPALRETLDQPLAPPISNLYGAFIELASLEMTDNLPTGGGTLAVYMKNPQFLVGMAQMFAPAVASLDLQPGAEPQPVPASALPQLQGTGLEAWIAMGETALGVAVGEAHVNALAEAVQTSPADDLLMTMRFDFAIWTTLFEMAEATLEPGEQTEALNAQRATYEALAEAYEQVGFKLRLGETGPEMVFESRLR